MDRGSSDKLAQRGDTLAKRLRLISVFIALLLLISLIYLLKVSPGSKEHRKESANAGDRGNTAEEATLEEATAENSTANSPGSKETSSLQGAESAESIAHIFFDGEEYLRFPMEKGKSLRFSLKIKPEVQFEIFPDASIAFIKSDCPDKICINTGRMSMPGAFAACLPNKLVLSLSDTPENLAEALQNGEILKLEDYQNEKIGVFIGDIVRK